LKIAVIGKGGSGKTTVSGVLARSLASKGLEVIALDCDANPNLGISLGVGASPTEELAAIRQSLDDGGAEHAPSVEELLERFGTAGPDGIRLAVVTKIEDPDPG
jgi:CO dehydrogenase maturation factor